MGLFDTTDLLLQRGLEGASMRQQVLANNLANANTAGFKRSDVDFESALQSALGDGSSTQSALEGMTFQPQTDSNSTMRADGNNVDADQENADLTQNAIQYESLLEVAHARLGMLKAAMGSGS